MPAKHVHEITLPDGAVIRTGEDIESDAPPGAPASSGAAGEPPGGGIGALRIGGIGALPERGKRVGAVKSVDLADLEAREAADAGKAIAAGQVSLLPEYGKEIWSRMYKSALRWSKDERKSAAAAWRAVRQKYALGKSLETAPAYAQGPTFHVEHPAKSVLLGTIADRRGRAFVVRLTEERDADVLYEKTEQVSVPGLPGIAITVGHLPPNIRNPISVLVPDSYVSGTPGGAGAIDFVRQNMHTIWAAAKGQLLSAITVSKRAPGGTTDERVRALPPAPAYPSGRVPRMKFVQKLADGTSRFVNDPRDATERIAYSEDYVPWEVDLQGEYATETEVARFAHAYMKSHGKVGEMHAGFEMQDGQPPGHTVEAFIARRGDPDFTPGAFVRAVEYHPAIWQKIVDGVYVGTSIAGRWATSPIFAAGAEGAR